MPTTTGLLRTFTLAAATLALTACGTTREPGEFSSSLHLGPGGRVAGTVLMLSESTTTVELENVGAARVDVVVRDGADRAILEGTLEPAETGTASSTSELLEIVIEAHADAPGAVLYAIRGPRDVELKWDLSGAYR